MFTRNSVVLLVMSVPLAWLGPAQRARGQPCELVELLAGDAAEDAFGFSVSIDGDVAVIGAPAGPAPVRIDEAPRRLTFGAAYVFERRAGIWEKVKTLTAEGDAGLGDQFGLSVSVSGNLAVIGAPGDDERGLNAGAAYVFERGGGVWTRVARLTQLSPLPFNRFGLSVAVSGNVAVVGTRFGYTSVFERNGGAWGQVANLRFHGHSDEGHSVSIDGNVVVIAVPEFFGTPAVFFNGAGFVFQRPVLGWEGDVEATATLTASEDRAQVPVPGNFGGSVSVSGNTVVIGADEQNCGGVAVHCGAAYVFQRPAVGWADMTETAKLTPNDLAVERARDHFGKSVSIRRDVVVVGANQTTETPLGRVYDGSGTAYVFQRGAAWDSGSVDQVARLTPFDALLGDQFGSSVSISGDVVVIGAPGHDEAGHDDAGAVYVRDCRDCNHNGRQDAGDIADGTSLDCQPNGVPDECDLVAGKGTSGDCNVNGVPDECEGSCGALLVQVNERRVGNGGATVTGIEGMQIAVFDQSEGSCARDFGLSPLNYPNIFVTCEVVSCRTTAPDGTGTVALDAGDYLVIGKFDPDGFPPNDDGDEEFIGIQARHFQCAANNDPNTVTMCKSIEVIILNNSQVIAVHPGPGGCGAIGGAADVGATENLMVELTNVAGPDESVSVITTIEEAQREAGGYLTSGSAVVVESALMAGELLMTVVVPFDESNLDGANPLSVDLTYYNPNTAFGGLAVTGNAQPSPGHEPDIIGDRFAVEGTTIPTLSQDLGDYGVFWNPAAGTGFVWANVDHAGEFAAGFRTQDEPIPTVSEWGMVVMTLLLLTGIQLKFGRRQSAGLGRCGTGGP